MTSSCGTTPEFLDARALTGPSRLRREMGPGRASKIEVDELVFNGFTVREGKIVRKVEFMDRAEALEAAGLSTAARR